MQSFIVILVLWFLFVFRFEKANIFYADLYLEAANWAQFHKAYLYK